MEKKLTAIPSGIVAVGDHCGRDGVVLLQSRVFAVLKKPSRWPSRALIFFFNKLITAKDLKKIF